ncbi:hypothetical protein NEOKW01_2128 [Nematocida sp. AWRm80]|nr:hypothetical protein NEOKW01_2128 [Nematocida sp. AWRm80]
MHLMYREHKMGIPPIPRHTSRKSHRYPAIKEKPTIGCIPVVDGRVYLVTNRKHEKLAFPLAVPSDRFPPYYTLGKKVLLQAGLVGQIDKKPLFTRHGIEWYMLEVTRVLDLWHHKHKRFRHAMSPKEALQHSEVRALAKDAIKRAVHIETEQAYPRLRSL